MAETLERPELSSLKKYIPGKSIEEVQRELGLAEVIKLASNENPLGPSPKAIAAMQEELAKVSLYPEPTCPALTVDVAARLGLEPENVIFGNGGDGLLTVMGQAFVCPGDEAIAAQPTFSIYQQIVHVMGGHYVSVPMGADLRHDLPGMAAAITPKTKLIFVCNPNNPTGTIVYKKETDWLLERVPKGAIVIFDEAYYDFVEHPDYPQTVDYVRQGLNVIVLRTFSKIYGLAGLRIGYALSTPALIDSMAKVRETFPVNRIAQAGARAALTDEEFRRKTIDVNSAGRRYLYQQFDELGISYVPSQSNFIFANFGVDSRDLFERLLRRGVVIRPGFIWDFNTWSRVTVGTQSDNEKFVTALRAVYKDLGLR